MDGEPGVGGGRAYTGLSSPNVEDISARAPTSFEDGKLHETIAGVFIIPEVTSTKG